MHISCPQCKYAVIESTNTACAYAETLEEVLDMLSGVEAICGVCSHCTFMLKVTYHLPINSSQVLLQSLRAAKTKHEDMPDIITINQIVYLVFGYTLFGNTYGNCQYVTVIKTAVGNIFYNNTKT